MTTSLSEYLVLSRGRWDVGLSPQEIQQAVDAFSVWYDRMVIAGRVRPGQRLSGEGKLVSRTRIVDGPYAQAREAIGGYWFLLAHSLEEAAALAAENPCLACGLTYEVRPVDVKRRHRSSDLDGVAM